MTKTHIFIFVLILFILSLGYLVIENNHQETVIKMPQIQIVSNQDNTKEKKDDKNESASEILSQLKIAVDMSRKNIEQSEEARANEILEMLKKKTHLTPSTEAKVREALATIETNMATNEETISKKITSKNILYSSKSIDIVKKKVIEKKVIEKKSVKQKNIVHKRITKKATSSKNIVKQMTASPKITKKFIVQRIQINRTTVKQVTRPIEPVAKKRVFLKPLKKKPSIKKPKVSVIKKDIPLKNPRSRLSREEEVLQYQEASSNGLEVIDESSLFEINEPKNARSDATYFESLQPDFEEPSNAPLEFVKTLGVVEVSQKYEVGNLEIPKMIELAKEGVVDISSATIETEALKKLKFIDPLEVVNVSPAFETIDAQKYIK